MGPELVRHRVPEFFGPRGKGFCIVVLFMFVGLFRCVLPVLLLGCVIVAILCLSVWFSVDCWFGGGLCPVGVVAV